MSIHMRLHCAVGDAEGDEGHDEANSADGLWIILGSILTPKATLKHRKEREKKAHTRLS